MSPASPPASGRVIAAILAAVLLAVAGCKSLTISTSGTSPATTAGPAATTPAAAASPGGAAPAAAASSTGSLVTEPGAGFSRIYGLINGARHSVDMTMYELADTTAEHALAAAARRGALVRVVLDGREKSENSPAYQYLRAHGARVVWSSSRYYYTHQKTLVIDHSTAVILTANLTSRYYSTSRDFAVIDSSRADVAAIERAFDADFSGAAVTPGNGQDLVWSPTDSQGKLLALINGARHSLRIYSEEMGDATVVDALIAAARRGVVVQVCGENEDGEYDSAFARLAPAGVHISYYGSPDGFYIHGKVIEADYGTGQAKVFIGSENFSATSLDRNRELGLITSRPAVLFSIAQTFATDFRRGQQWSS